MKKYIMWIVLSIALASSMASGEGLLDRFFNTMIPGRGEMKPLATPGEPVEDLTVKELLVRMVDLEGQVVQVDFDHAIGLRQVEDGYIVVITFESINIWEGLLLEVPAEGLEFFKKATEKDYRSDQDLYVQISKNGRVSRALGLRYRKSEQAGEQYAW
jgi:hypothetical protein